MNSPYGRRGSLCKEMGWGWNEIHHSISWATLQKIIADLPQFHYNEKTVSKVKLNSTIELDEASASELEDAITKQM